MATIKEILNIEQTREDNTLIHLFAEGSFWRAYELSSWLCFRFVNEFKPTKRRIKGIDATVTFVGFPRQSLQKFIPADWQVDMSQEKHIIVKLPDEKLSEVKTESFGELFNVWKENLEEVVPNKDTALAKITPPRMDNVRHCHITDIMREILVYPLENKTPLENMEFIGAIKRRLSEII